MLKQIEKKPVIRDCCRVTGMRKSNSKRERPINFTLRSSDMVNQILIKAKILRTKEGYNSIYISLDNRF